MTELEKLQVQKAIALTAAYYSRTLSQQVLDMYAEDLSDLDASKVISAYGAYRRNSQHKTFPIPAQIREIIEPASPTAQASGREVVAMIQKAIRDYGYMSGEAARAEIGESAWSIVDAFGGWHHLCTSSNFDWSHFSAQARELATVRFQYGHGLLADSVRDRRDAGGDLANPFSEQPKLEMSEEKLNENKQKLAGIIPLKTEEQTA